MLALVMVPGLLCDETLFAAQVRALGGAREVRVADLRGCRSLREMARRVLEGAPDRFALAGLSMGGYVAFELLREAPERVDRLALLDTNARADLPEQSAKRLELIALGRREGLRKVQGALLPFLIHKERLCDKALVSAVLDMTAGYTVEDFEGQQQAIMARPDNRPFLRDIACPTRVIVGRDDLLTPVKVAEEMAQGVRASRLSVIENCGHLSTLERPDAVTAELKDWLDA